MFLRGILLLCAGATGAGAHALDADVRFKLFGTGAFLPAHDFQRQQTSTPIWDANVDGRIMLRHTQDNLEFVVHHSTVLLSGDSFAFMSAPQTQLDQTPQDDVRRPLDLTWNLEDGGRHRSFHRLDRLAVKYRGGKWGLTVGREAVSWGSGQVFQPMDLFNPFAPTAVDRDYKAGDDLLLIERLFDDGSDLQVLAVARRDADEDLTGQAGSLAVKWHTFLGGSELELVAAKHYRDRLVGMSYRLPLGGALLRMDVVGTRLRDAGWEITGLLNADYSFLLADRNAYVFAEYFHNGFGVDDLGDSAAELPQALLSRVERGELFNLMRDYLAAGINYQWHPLLNQSVTLITNLHDSSSLLQSQLTYEPGDHQRLEAGFLLPLGRGGDEFGGIPLATRRLTTGGGRTLYLRWTYYL